MTYSNQKKDIELLIVTAFFCVSSNLPVRKHIGNNGGL